MDIEELQWSFTIEYKCQYINEQKIKYKNVQNF